MNSFARLSSDRVHSLSTFGGPVDVSPLFPTPDPSAFALNILSVLMMYGPFYLANTGAMPVSYTHLTLPTICSV